MFIARAADLIADENIRCRGLERIDPARQSWLLLDLDAADFLSDAGWRVVGAYASEAEALAAAPAGEKVAPLPALAAAGAGADGAVLAAG